MPDAAQHLDRLHAVNGAYHQPVVTLGVTVVEMDAEDATMPRGQHRSIGGLLVRVEHVREVERHP